MRHPPLWKFDSGMLDEFPVLCGVDEVGRGPLAGNVVAACVILDFKAKPIAGLNDSKKLSPAVRESLSAEIRERALAYGVGECSPQEIVPPGLLLVDGNQRIPDVAWPQRTLVKGDGRSASIAAASILAKVVRDRQMSEMHALYPVYGFDAHKGYATQVHRDAIEKYGLTPIHRKTFCTDPEESEDLFAQDMTDETIFPVGKL
jgi:ribonuclease HII